MRSSQARREPTPAAASSFCSRTPSGSCTSTVGRSLAHAAAGSAGSAWSCRRTARPAAASAGPVPLVRAGLPARRRMRPTLPDPCGPASARAGLRDCVGGVIRVLVRRARRARRPRAGRAPGRAARRGCQAQPLQEVGGGAVEDRAALAVGAELLDQAAGEQGADDAVDVDAADRADPRPRRPAGGRRSRPASRARPGSAWPAGRRAGTSRPPGRSRSGCRSASHRRPTRSVKPRCCAAYSASSSARCARDVVDGQLERRGERRSR